MRAPPEHKCTADCRELGDESHEDFVQAERAEWLAGYGDYLNDQDKDDRLTGDR